MKNVLKHKEMGLVIILVAVSFIITIKNPAFLSVDNIMNILKGNVVLAIVSLGMLLVMITGGIDVSVGGIIAATTLFVGNFMVSYTGNVILSFLLGMVIGSCMGILNGLLIAFIKLPPIVETLGMYSIISGFMLYITKGAYINNIPDNFPAFGKITVLNVIPNGRGGMTGVPVQILILAAVVVLTHIIMKYTKVGRGIFAIGGNRLSAERLGFHVKKITVFVYGYMGFICGTAAMTHVSILKQIDPNAFNGYDMKVIAAVILGGVNVMGGEGSITGTLLGVALFAVINNGLTLMKVSSYWQKVILGVFMVFSICFVVIGKRRAGRHLAKVDIEEG